MFGGRMDRNPQTSPQPPEVLLIQSFTSTLVVTVGFRVPLLYTLVPCSCRQVRAVRWPPHAIASLLAQPAFHCHCNRRRFLFVTRLSQIPRIHRDAHPDLLPEPGDNPDNHPIASYSESAQPRRSSTTPGNTHVVDKKMAASSLLFR